MSKLEKMNNDEKIKETITCDQCGSNDVNIQNEKFGVCNHCGAKFIIKNNTINNFLNINLQDLYSFDSDVNDDYLDQNFDSTNDVSFEPANNTETNETNEETNESHDLPKKQKHKFLTDGYLFSFLTIFFIVFSSFIFVFNYVLHPIKVVGTSMHPTINYNSENTGDSDSTHCDIVYYSKENYYNNNDIVVINNPNKKYVSYSSEKEVPSIIKRVIATPNQSVKFILDKTESGFSSSHEIIYKYFYKIEVYDSNNININLDQSYLSEDEEMYFTSQELYYFSRPENSQYKTFYDIFNEVAHSSSKSYTYQVEEGKYFVMGDNRDNSTDSRFFGAVDYEDIDGSVKIIVPYGSTLIQSLWTKIKNYA